MTSDDINVRHKQVSISYFHEMSRKSKNAWMVGSFRDKSLAEANRLPTNRDVISRYLFFRKDKKSESVRAIFHIILIELEVVWNKAAIPLKEKEKRLDQLIYLYERWNSLKKTSLSLRQKPSKKIQTNIESFEKELDRLCDLSSHDAYDQLPSYRRKNWREDWIFYENQKTSRTYHITSLDQESYRIEKRRQSRALHQEQLLQQSLIPLIDSTVSFESSDSEASTDSSLNQDDFRLPSPKKGRNQRQLIYYYHQLS